MPLVGTPAVDERARDTKGLQPCLAFQKGRVLPASKHRGEHRACVVSHGVPSPTWRGFAAHVAPPLVELGTASPTYRQRIRTPSRHLPVLWGQGLQDGLMPLREGRGLVVR